METGGGGQIITAHKRNVQDRKYAALEWRQSYRLASLERRQFPQLPAKFINQKSGRHIHTPTPVLSGAQATEAEASAAS